MRTRLAMLFALLALGGCHGSGGDQLEGNRLEGTYHADTGAAITIDFTGGKARVSIGGDQKVLEYRVEGDKLTILDAEDGDMVLTINSDGTLDAGMMGTLSKRQ